MKCEQFYYGLFDHYGIKLVKSPNLNSLLTSEIVEYLCQLGGKNKEPEEYSNLWPNGVITVTRVHRTHDEYGRNGVWNHTIAVRLMEYLAYAQPTKVLSRHFKDKPKVPPVILEPITII